MSASTLNRSPSFVAPAAPAVTQAGAKAIETRYKGHRFRSRLEARYAVLLDALGVEWAYETQGYDLNGVAFLCDFWLPRQGAWVEVKAAYDEDAYNLLGELVKATDCNAGFMVCGLNELDSHWWAKVRPSRLPSWLRSEAGTRRRALFRLDPDLHGFMANGRGEVVWYPLRWLAKGNDALLAEAVTAARSARFEHGEQP